MRACRLILLIALLGFGSFAPAATTYRAEGYLTDATHPKRPGDSHRIDVRVTVTLDPVTAEASIAIETDLAGKSAIAQYFIGHGRVFQRDAEGREIAASSLGDVSPAVIAALHPAVVDSTLTIRREDLARRGSQGWFAWNDVLWTLAFARRGEAVTALRHDVAHDLFGDTVESVSYRQRREGGTHVTVTAFERTLADLSFTAGTPALEWEGIGAIDRQNDRARVVSDREIQFTELAPGVHMIALAALDLRVFVAEFGDHVIVLEGAYSSAVGDRLAQAIRRHFGKPVRYFAFSHLHGQYVGGVRSWVAEGATILVPPSTAPLIKDVLAAPHRLHPDAQAAVRAPLKLHTIAAHERIADETNRLDIYNVDSAHTDDYFIFHFPAQKLLLTGDLMMYRPGQALRGRSRKLCATVQSLGLGVDRYVGSWPLNSFGIQGIVEHSEVQRACAMPEPPAS
ncbi:hypothetical protein [Tahibacter amnicola]|uniref:Glyoxylase-like metal-dependent hydrolase (Beta-lactamase superfamily II) n=1 Tax=Tahibacter amnicola TaxID=2976241 RepID=A0ABY6BJC0_9GAMM|nr:hypothetical protein [Tahibacter amnicola]UXI70113.1 hypothetical protein N4264_10930 [Tahibacter amnicola]